MKFFRATLLVLPVLLLCQCGLGIPQRNALNLVSTENVAPRKLAPSSPEWRAKVMALDPNNVTESDVQNILSKGPAPHVLCLHGGIQGVQQGMVDVSEFLRRMGYPRASLGLPDGTWSMSCYESSKKMTGVVAWYYERDGMRPMLIGHSQGAMAINKILHDLDANPKFSRAKVFNPVSWEFEDRHEIIDPLTGQKRPVVGLSISYATAVGGGGVTRFLPNTYDTLFTLRSVPDSVSEYTGFCKEYDLLGGDFLGYGSVNEYHAKGTAKVRNVWLPAEYSHSWAVYCQHLASQVGTRAWINNYRPAAELPGIPIFTNGENNMNILWAADVWHSVKRNWVLELQTLLKSGRA
jgi:hypothetical protein